jgi:hypothetical protein
MMKTVLVALVVLLWSGAAPAALIVEIHPMDDGVVAPDDLEIYASATVPSSVLRGRPAGLLFVPFVPILPFPSPLSVRVGEELAVVLRSTAERVIWFGVGSDPYADGYPMIRDHESPIGLFWATRPLATVDLGFALCVRPFDAEGCVDTGGYLPDLEDVTVAGVVSPTVDVAQSFIVTHAGTLGGVTLLIAVAGPATVPGPPTWALLGLGAAGFLLLRGRARFGA